MDAADREAAAALGLSAGDHPAPEMPAGFWVLPQCWIVERTFAWLMRNRRSAKDWEGLPATTETWIYLAMDRLMTKRLAHAVI